MTKIKLFNSNLNNLLPIGNYVDIKLPEAFNILSTYKYSDIIDNSLYFIEACPDKNNPIEYHGIKIGLGIYFMHLQEKKFNFKIILCGFDNELSIFKNYKYARFLTCPGVSYHQFSFQEDYTIPNIDKINPREAEDSLKGLKIELPNSYHSQHSITNEWSIYRWTKYLGQKPDIEEKIKESFYFDYLRTINHIDTVTSNRNVLLENGKILLIDDEVGKGWDSFFKNWKSPGSQLKIKTLGADFKGKKHLEDILEKAKKEIVKFNPDTIILDLRLHDSDFNQTAPTELTGFKLLKIIKKEINPGIQVIIFSATNKIWNYKALSDIGFDGWATKEAPDVSEDRGVTKSLISELKNQIGYCLSRKDFKYFFQRRGNLLKKIKRPKLKSELGSQIDISLELAYKANTEDEFAHAYISLNTIFEIINKYFIERDGEDKWSIDNKDYLADWAYDKSKREFIKRDSIFNSKNCPEWKKIAGIILQYYNLREHQLLHVIQIHINKRNWYIHKDERLNYKNEKGDYPNHDIYKLSGFYKLFRTIEKIISYIE